MFGGGGDMDEMMSAFFGGGGGGMGGRPRRRKGRDVGHAMPVTLDDLYNGKTVEIPREKTMLCATCSGRGTTKPGAGGKCAVCRGAGARLVMHQMGMMVQQMQVRCDACNGEGMKIDPKDRCKTCNGQRTTEEPMPLTVVIQRGMEHQQQIPFPGEGDQHPDIDVPGDIVIVLQQIKHDRFVRDGCDLHMKQSLTLAQALCGFAFVVTHLDGRKLIVRSTPGEIIKPGDKKCIPSEGMPVWQRGATRGPTKFGDLVIEFTVTFPERLADSQVLTLRESLPPPSSTGAAAAAGDDAHECFLNRQALDELRREIEKDEDDDEEEEGGGGGRGPGVQCAHQ